MEKIRKKKKSQKTKPKNTETTKESDFLPFLLHPLSIVVQTMQNLYYTRFKKKKKKLLLQTPGPNFFSDGQTEERSVWKANVWNRHITVARLFFEHRAYRVKNEEEEERGFHVFHGEGTKDKRRGGGWKCETINENNFMRGGSQFDRLCNLFRAFLSFLRVEWQQRLINWRREIQYALLLGYK